MIAAISLARREEEQLREESFQIIKVVDQPTTGKNNSFSTLTCKSPTMLDESIVTKVKVLELKLISSKKLDVSDIDNCSNIEEVMSPVMDEENKMLSLVSAGYTVDNELVEIPPL
jgi:hypothetical protein